MANIKKVFARQILDSRGNPTVEATIVLDNGITASSSCPSGASVGTYEALELRDKDAYKMHGMGVEKAVKTVIEVIGPKLIDVDVKDQKKIDSIMIETDGTENKEKLGSNSILSVSMAVCKAAAISENLPLYKYIAKLCQNNNPLKIPTPLFNILNGGKHAGGNIDFQEFMVIPSKDKPYSEQLEIGVSVYFSLKKILEDKHLPTLVGDEGGFAPTLSDNADGLRLIKDAVDSTTLKYGIDVTPGIDAASNTFYKNSAYVLKGKPNPLSVDELIVYYSALNEAYELTYLEDPFSEDDFNAWEKLAKTLYSQTLIVGDDLVVTNPKRLQMAIDKKAITATIIKLNQIGTVSETIDVVNIARAADIKIIVSHRSGETTDDFVADFAVGVGADMAKFGAPARGERVAKYNRLLKIEEELLINP